MRQPLFYERIAQPGRVERPPVLMLHGGLHTGRCFLQTADGRPGWAQLFAASGYPVIVPDWPGHGRSPALSAEELTGEFVCQALADLLLEIGEPVVLLTHSMGGAFGWRVAELCASRVLAVAAVAPGPPGNIQPEPHIIDESEDEVSVRTGERTAVLHKHGFVDLDRGYIANKLIGGSTRFPPTCTDAYLASLTSTSARLLYERLNVHGSQVCMTDPRCLSGKPVLVLTGTEDIDHPRGADAALAEWLAAQGADATHAWLGDLGIQGNGHMLMLETNSDETGRVVLEWLDTVLRPD